MLLTILLSLCNINKGAAMKINININIGLQVSITAEPNRLVRFVNNIDATLNAIELELESYRRRLERVEEMTTRFESGQEES
jgi:hypothetical protein